MFSRRLLWRILLIATLALLILAVLLAGYLMQIDRRITSTFEGRRWSVPAIVYAQPLELYPGRLLDASALSAELERVGYLSRPDVRLPGEYRLGADLAEIYLRGFQYPEGARPAQRIRIGFRSGAIASVTDGDEQELPLLRLDPPAIGSIYPSHGEDRVVLTPEQVPALLREALKTVEDQRFDQHHGFDLKGILRAAWTNLRHGELAQGGSTLTQQLVKSYFLSNERTLQRKLKELAMSIVLEARFSKTDLLNAYINEIYLGQAGKRAIHGFGLGAQFYFNKPLNELAVAEVATLVAIIRGPSYYNPYRYPQRVRARRDLVLTKLADSALIDAATLADAQAAPLGVITGRRRGGTYYPAFMELVRQDLAASYSDEQLASDGLRVFTTLNPVLQDQLDAAVDARLSALEARRERATGAPAAGLEAAAVITDTQTGDVLALAGGRRASFDGYNRALHANRPVGSLIKPAVYLTALEQGATLATRIEDRQLALRGPDGALWTPQNFSGESYGTVSLARALADSLNLATVQLGLRLGVDTVRHRLAQLNQAEPRNPYPSLLLGAEEMTVLEVARLYGNFAGGGFRVEPRSVITVLSETNEPLSHHPIRLEESIDPAANELLVHGLKLVMTQGTGRSSRHRGQQVAGKTGTSDDYRDSWFAGFDARRMTVVWIGNDDNEPTGLTGASGALALWDDIMAAEPVQPLGQPQLPASVRVELATGYAVPDGCRTVEAVLLPFRQQPALPLHPDCEAERGGPGRWLRNRLAKQTP
ncbi:MAG: penicillin-binding protein 1B [Pseudomonadota bacterium]